MMHYNIKMPFVWYNYKIFNPESLINAQSQHFINDYLFSFYFSGRPDRIRIFNELFQFLQKQFNTFNLTETDILVGNGNLLQSEISRILIRNKQYKDNLISLHFFKNSINFDLLIDVVPYPEPDQKSQYIFQSISGFSSPIASNIRSISQLFIHELKKRIVNNHEIILIDDNEVIATSSGILFIKKDDELTTLSQPNETIELLVSHSILELSSKVNLSPKRVPTLQIDEVLKADELFTFSIQYGFKSISKLMNQRFFTSDTKKIIEFYEQK